MYIYIYSMQNPRRSSAHAETQTCGTDSPNRRKSCALSITPSHHPQKKDCSTMDFRAHMIRSTQESLEVSTYTWHTKSVVQMRAPLCSLQGNQSDWLRHIIQVVNEWWHGSNHACWKSVIEPSFFWGWCNGVMDSARDFYLLGESVL